MNVLTHRNHNPSVLLVDDDSENRELIQIKLVMCGYRVEAAGSPEEALNIVRAGFSPDVAVLGVGVVECDGFELLARLRAMRSSNEPTLPAIFVSETDNPIDEIQGRILGGVFLTKPMAIETLQKAVFDVSENPDSAIHLGGRRGIRTHRRPG